MRIPLFVLALLLLPLALPASHAEGEDGQVRARVHHQLFVTLDPAGHGIRVRDEVTFPAGTAGLQQAPDGGLDFALHGGLVVTTGHTDLVVEALGDLASHGVPLKSWRVRAASGGPLPRAVKLNYEGVIHHPPVEEAEEYARSFARSPGTIGEDGVVLTRATWWVPHFGEDLLTFHLTAAHMPEGWLAVSQGKRVPNKRGQYWVCDHPMEEVYLIANRYTRFEREAPGDVEAEAYLRTPAEGEGEPDANLANRYLEATVQYVDMYRRLIGPYPFSKFALVENFWETGYGMPSFTLLGPTVIRLPFILHSSYPHEILHNWWGNSVYVDWATGNWCEGLTAYLADHLIREGQGRGAQYRFDTLKKYGSYVSSGRDFPLTQFVSRRSGATEAIGYGKALMVFHMLRRLLGDDVFTRGLRSFYQDQLWKSASWADVTRVFSTVSGRNLEPFLRAWVERSGAPQLAVTATFDADGALRVKVRQTQAEAPFPLAVPLAVTLEGRTDALLVDVEMTGREHEMVIPLEGKALRVDLDPTFDVFRRMDPAETPTTLGDLFGAEGVTLIVPALDTEPLAAGWRAFAAAWAGRGGGQAKLVPEDAIEALPTEGAVWVLGANNRWAEALRDQLETFGAGAKDGKILLGEGSVDEANHSWVFAVRHPDDPSAPLGWVGTNVAAALPGLARKLPHYGRYSFLAFEGDAPDNVAKGQWPALASPLTLVLSKTSDGRIPAPATLPKQEPLARLAPAFDPSRLMAHVRTLADDRMRGRGVGDPMLDEAADYVAAQFEAAGLVPGGDDGSFFQAFQAEDGPEGRTVTLKNVIGVLKGTKDAWKEQSVVVGAHYDHLGLGWPDVRAGNEGQIHNGADDNASGVAVLIELARVLAADLEPDRSIVFVAFTGEEWGLKGSKHYTEAMKTWPAKQALGMVNLDTVGRLHNTKLLMLGSGTATEWPHIARGVSYTTGVESLCVKEDPEGSDQASFQRVGVPAIQLFTRATEDYHRPTDDIEKVDGDGLVKVATFTKETVVYLSQRPDPLTSTLGGAAPAAARPPSAGQRKVSLGTVPDFAHPGPGVLVQSVVTGSAAEEAGLAAGDVLLAINDVELESLRHYSTVLKQHAPGDVVRVRVKRGEEELTLPATLRAR